MQSDHTSVIEKVVATPHRRQPSPVPGLSGTELREYIAKEWLFEQAPQWSAKYLFSGNVLQRIIGIVLIILGIFILSPAQITTSFFLFLNVFYAAVLIFKGVLMAIGYIRSQIASLTQKHIEGNDSTLPIYTILVPLYKETNVIPRLINALNALNYPTDKLDIKLITEEDDTETINVIKSANIGPQFDLIQVPYSLPRTKPKACNYALQYAKGEFVTIYDAEDIPDPLQLRKVLWVFQHSKDNVVCVQARLNYFNRTENILSRMFAFEYSNLFDFVLFGLQAMGIPIPLGGTSNHFRMDKLHELYAWDPYNVTEDADLGIRLAHKGWKTKIVQSLTLEECPITLKAWMVQRTRWIKGHIQTYCVHMRQPLRLLRAVGPIGFFGFQLFFGAQTIIFMLAPIMWSVWLTLMLGGIELTTHMPEWFTPVLYFSYGILVFGLWAQIGFAAASIWRNNWKDMTPYCLVFPFYWFLHSIASFRAVAQLITRPHYWGKTTHGITKISPETNTTPTKK
jgi:cellulose synthase/poly-beta-1,6-N-acetylglucosamine synthase-like glycosyltransferase